MISKQWNHDVSSKDKSFILNNLNHFFHALFFFQTSTKVLPSWKCAFSAGYRPATDSHHSRGCSHHEGGGLLPFPFPFSFKFPPGRGDLNREVGRG